MKKKHSYEKEAIIPVMALPVNPCTNRDNNPT